jgi:hypothetical protein
MFANAVITVLCMAAIAFYVRFLVALSKERKPRLIGYSVRVRLGSGEDAIAELHERKKPVTRLRENRVNHRESRKDIGCLSKRYQRNNWQSSSTTIMKPSGPILAAPASRMKHGSRYHNRKKAVWWLLPVWHYWNWPQRTENGKTRGAISRSRVKPNGAADPRNAVEESVSLT